MPGVDGKLETAVSKGADGAVGVVHTLNHSSTIERMDFHLLPLAAPAFKHELGHSRFFDSQLYILVHIAVGMAGDGDRLLPCLHHGTDARDGDGGTKHCTVEDASNGTVGAFPHLV